MNNKFYKFVLIIFCMCIFPTLVNASYYCRVQDGRKEVRVRSDYNATGNNGVLTFVNGGASFEMPSNQVVATNDNCPAGWYKVDYEGKTGYICASMVDVYERNDTPVIDNTEAKTACEADLKAKGFPSSYWSGLCSLKVKYPNWDFQPVNTGLDYADAVSKESKCGKNTITNKANAEYIDTSCSSALDSGSAHASSKAIAYYLNPLNFLNEDTIFMFEDQYINKNISTDSYTTAAGKTFAKKTTDAIPYMLELVANASNESGLNQMAISARFKKELGTGFSSNGLMYCIIAGNYTTKYHWYYGANANPTWAQNDPTNRVNLDLYYNWFNIGANDGSDVTKRSFAFAVNSGWGGTADQKTNRQLAMTGGSKWIVRNYLDVGQNTVYFNKFNTHPNKTSNLYAHQYMSDIQAPEAESKIVYNAYKSTNMLNSNFVFYIPIYSNLGAVINNDPDGATNENVNNDSGGVAPATMVVSSGLKVNSNIITGIKPGTSMADIKNKITALGGSVSSSNNGLAGTGTRITISNGTNSTEFVIVVKGDTSGDGVINALDLLQVQKNILGLYDLKNEYKLAGDTSGDGNINALDLLQVQKQILGSYTIEQ